MITDIQTVKFFRTEKDTTNDGYNPEYGLLVCINDDMIVIIDDKGFIVIGVWSYLEMNNIGLHKLKIGNSN